MPIKKQEQQTQCWYGNKKYHYVVKRGGHIVYRCTSVGDYQDQVLDTLIDRYGNDTKEVYIYRNTALLMVLNKPTKKSKWS